ncbi:uncharacterized protein LOC134529404 [Bacillus rossius redtenbacheri]|uniref:uncharacterized protein LOC134529404 n=1 Tax=Bacillus rossius redtenbacheri TaxID=93214 RepID=UPI002FDD51CE
MVLVIVVTFFSWKKFLFCPWYSEKRGLTLLPQWLLFLKPYTYNSYKFSVWRSFSFALGVPKIKGSVVTQLLYFVEPYTSAVMLGAESQNTDISNEDDRILLAQPSATSEVVETVREIEPIAGTSREDNREEFENVPSVALSGNRRGIIVYYDGKGHLFHFDKEKHGKRFLKCAKYHAGCRARASMNLEDGSPIKPTLRSVLHNHGPNPQCVGVIQFRKLLSQRSSVETTLPLAMIYNDEVQRNPESATQLPFNVVRRTMARRRRESVPTVPASLPDLVEVFLNPMVLQHYGQIFNATFYGGPVHDSTGALAAIAFFNNDICSVVSEHPSEVREVGMDGTFKVVPSSPRGFVQLFTVQVIFMDVAFPILFALMCSRTEAAYVAVLTHFKEATEQ